jgi:hypothetical protein
MAIGAPKCHLHKMPQYVNASNLNRDPSARIFRMAVCGFSEWLCVWQDCYSPYRYDLGYHHLIQEQNDIGWRHISNAGLHLNG